MATILVSGSEVRLNPQDIIGQGWEADIYRFGGGQALKLYKPPDHPDLGGQPEAMTAARKRLSVHQRKLPMFPIGLPSTVITPQELAYNQSGNQIRGYVMPLVSPAEVLLRFSERKFRQNRISDQEVVSIFQNLHQTVHQTHRQGVVIGDFNDLNVLVKDATAYLIDADSFQFGGYPCLTYTERFGDPTHMRAKTGQEKDLQGGTLTLASPHTELSDWYAYTVMLFRSLLYVDPYGGRYKPKEPSNRVPHPERPLHRITVFHPEVTYPKPATPYQVLPDELLEYFQAVFAKDMREEFPAHLLQTLQWTTCSKCNKSHARPVCPFCFVASPQVVTATMQVRGKVVATRIFTTPGAIVHATVQNGQLLWLYHESGQLKREDGAVMLDGSLPTEVRYRIHGSQTILGHQGTLISLDSSSPPERAGVDSYGTLPMFDTNHSAKYWSQGGAIYRDSPTIGAIAMPPTRIGSVLEKQTLFWVGPAFGFGFYRAGALQTAFVFDAHSNKLNDTVRFPAIQGQLIDSTCVFSDRRCWFLQTVRQSGQTKNYCTVLDNHGQVLATSTANEGDGSWLGTIRGKCATGDFLFSPTDNGVVRVSLENGQISGPHEFLDTEPYVESDSQLFISSSGLHAVSNHHIWHLKM